VEKEKHHHDGSPASERWLKRYGSGTGSELSGTNAKEAWKGEENEAHGRHTLDQLWPEISCALATPAPTL